MAARVKPMTLIRNIRVPNEMRPFAMLSSSKDVNLLLDIAQVQNVMLHVLIDVIIMLTDIYAVLLNC